MTSILRKYIRDSILTEAGLTKKPAQRVTRGKPNIEAAIEGYIEEFGLSPSEAVFFRKNPEEVAKLKSFKDYLQNSSRKQPLSPEEREAAQKETGDAEEREIGRAHV